MTCYLAFSVLFEEIIIKPDQMKTIIYVVKNLLDSGVIKINIIRN